MLIDGQGKKILAGDTPITWAEWQKENGGKKNQPAVLAFPHDEDVGQLEKNMHRFKEIILHFPLFKDGRAYSQARLLREELGFEGHLRASGDIGEDQIFFMRRCGFDRFEVAEGATGAWEKALKGFSLVYQPSGGEETTIWERRR